MQLGVTTSQTPFTDNGYDDKGKSASDGTYHVNTYVISYGQGSVTLNLGGNANLNGATATGNTIKADIGINLNITCLVDTLNIIIHHNTISAGFGKH